MQISEAITQRRSIKRYSDRPVSREEVETVLAAAVLAPNHRLTQPWRFYVLGPQARHAYGLVLGGRKAKKIEDPIARLLYTSDAADERSRGYLGGVRILKKKKNTRVGVRAHWSQLHSATVSEWRTRIAARCHERLTRLRL